MSQYCHESKINLMPKAMNNISKHSSFLFGLVLSLLLNPYLISAETTLTLGSISGTEGDKVTVPVYMTSTTEVVAAQFDIYYDPELVSIGKMVDGAGLEDHESDVQEISDGIMRVALLSQNNTPFNNGSLMDVQLSFNKAVESGSGAISLKNILLINNDVESLPFTELEPVGKPTIQVVNATVVGSTVNFSAVVATTAGLSYQWDFGDGDTSSKAAPSHVFNQTGNYFVTLGVSNLISSASTTALVNVGQGGAVVVITNLVQAADGFPKTVSVITDPPNLPATVTYNGSDQAPSKAGSYTVKVTIEDDNYEGSVEGTLSVLGWLDTLASEPQALGGGWSKVDWFGYLNDIGDAWVYHNDHGWIFPISSGEDSLWMYWPEGDWTWTGKGVYPYIFRSGNQEEDGSWLHYFQGSRNPSILFDYGSQRWMTRNP